MIFGLEQEGGSLIALMALGTSSPSHWQQVEEQAPKPVDWTICFLPMTLVPVQKLCVINIYIYMIDCIVWFRHFWQSIIKHNNNSIKTIKNI